MASQEITDQKGESHDQNGGGILTANKKHTKIEII